MHAPPSIHSPTCSSRHPCGEGRTIFHGESMRPQSTSSIAELLQPHASLIMLRKPFQSAFWILEWKEYVSPWKSFTAGYSLVVRNSQ
uniref:Uncharacterized protein n=1 Tax=Aegilops tauschii subsp. strangulata TaxID=200361 RepID=A0A453QNZ1_AEGTS